jgi:hypothetical protein
MSLLFSKLFTASVSQDNAIFVYEINDIDCGIKFIIQKIGDTSPTLTKVINNGIDVVPILSNTLCVFDTIDTFGTLNSLTDYDIYFVIYNSTDTSDTLTKLTFRTGQTVTPPIPISTPEWSLIERTLQLWAVVNSGLQTIWRHQNAPEPDRAYLVLHIDSITPIGRDFETSPDENGVRKLYGTREFALSIICFGTNGVIDNVVPSVPNVDPTATLNNILQTTFKKDVSAALRLGNVITVDFEPVIDNSYVEGKHWVERADGILNCRTSVCTQYGGDNSETQIIEHLKTQGIFLPDSIQKEITMEV